MTQKKFPFPTSQKEMEHLAYNDCVYAWLLAHSYNNPDEMHSYIYKNSFTLTQIGRDIHRSRQTVSRRLEELIQSEKNPCGFIREKIILGDRVYILPYRNPFQYLHSETVVKLLNLPLKDQKEELIKTLAYVLEKRNLYLRQGKSNFTITSKEIIEYFGHSIGNKQTYERIRMNLTVLQGAGIIKFKTVNYDDKVGMPPMMFVYQVNENGKASDEWLGK